MPSALITPAGEVRLGVFSKPIDTINHTDFNLRTPMGRRAGGLARWLGFNQFEFLGGLGPDVAFGVAIADVRYAGTGFAYVQDRQTAARTQCSVTRPLGMGFDFVQTPETGTSRLASGPLKVEMTGEPGRRRLKAVGKNIDIDAIFEEDDMAPLRICTKAGATGWVYARKTAGHRVHGTLKWDGRTLDLATARVLGHHDWSAGYMRRETFWNWGCLAGHTQDGRVVGMNVSCGVNETSFQENCFWVDGRLHRLPPVHFHYTLDDLHKPWRLTDEAGRVVLDFTSEGAHGERIQGGVVASNFTQLLGRYSGHLIADDGEHIELEELPGYAEWHYAKW